MCGEALVEEPNRFKMRSSERGQVWESIAENLNAMPSLKFSYSVVCGNLVPRSHSVSGNVRSGKVRFRACSVPARPEIRAFLSLRMLVLSVVILGDFAE